MAPPKDDEIVSEIRSIITKAVDTDTLGDYTKRKIREMLRDHFGVDLESKKKFINETTADQIKSVTTERAQAQANSSSSKSSSPGKKPEQAPKAKPASSSSLSKTTTPIKRKAPSSDEEEQQQHDAVSADDGSEEDGEEQFSEIEEETSVSRKKPKTKASKSSPVKPTKAKKPATGGTSAASGSEAELTRLKKLVSEAGVRKPWKKLYEAASVDQDDFAGQCRVVQAVMKELGFSGRGSVEQARKIRDQREFADELAALQDNTVIDNDGRARRTRASVGSTSSTKKNRGPITVSDDSDSDEDEDASDFEEVAAPKPCSKASKASAAPQADTDSEDSEDQGPTRSKSFKSSLASFAADLNSDSD